MTLAPSYVAVKRKRDDAPIQSLILEERRTKHARVNVEYKLESISQASNEQPEAAGETKSKAPTEKTSEKDTPSKAPFVKKTDTLAHKAVKRSGPRHFELATGKRSADTAGLLPTFIERSAKRTTADAEAEETKRETPLKRPGTKSTGQKPSSAASQLKALGRTGPSAALSAKLSQLAVEEGEPPPKPKVIAPPKATPRRPKAADGTPRTPFVGGGLSASGEHAEPPSEDEDYVYDIYIRSTSTPCRPVVPPPPQQQQPPTPVSPFPHNHAPLSPVPTDSTAPRSLLDTRFPSTLPSLADYSPGDDDVGYLILPDSSSSSYFWTSDPTATKPAHDGSGSDDEGGDDEDSNAEDYYGADYPEDEVDFDDEMGRGAYGFRKGDSESEDEFGAGWSGRRVDEDEDESDEESDGAGANPWKRFMARERRVMDKEDQNEEEA